MTASVTHLYQPNKDVIREFLLWVFDGFPEVSDGLIQIIPSTPDGALNQNVSGWFSLDEIDDAVEFAAKNNIITGQSVYFGAALRRPDHAPFGSATDDDFYALTCAYADFDEPGDDARAKDIYQQHHCPPSFVVVTGREPHRRAQMWWRLKAPITDAAEARALNSHLANSLNGDKAVVNASRPMRLPGTISWPKPNKPGRVIELTELKRVSPSSYHADDARLWSMPIAEREVTEYRPRDPGNQNTTHTEQGKEYRTEVHGLREERIVVDGREQHARDIILRKLIDFIGENGAAPTADELHAEAWPVFAETTDLTRPGRGENFFRAKVRSTLYRFGAGRIGGLEDIGAAVKAYRERAHETPRAEAHLPPQPDATDAGPLIWFKDADTSAGSFDFVEGVLTDAAMSVVYGESNCGKTFFCTDLALHVALGREWRGREVEQGAVIYCALEGRAGITNRAVAFRKRNALGGKDVPFAILPVPINLLDPAADTPRLIELIKATQASRLDGKPVRLVVIDTLSRALAGGNENAPDDMGALVTNADRIRAETGAHLLFVHHSGKDQARGARGHSSLRAATDTEIEITKADSVSVARVTKQRDLEISDDELAFTLESVDVGVNQRGKPITSCIVVPYEGAITRTDKAKRTTNQNLIERALENALTNGARTPPFKDMAGLKAVPETEWRAEFEAIYASDDKDTDTVRRTFSRLRDKLALSGVVQIRRGWAWR